MENNKVPFVQTEVCAYLDGAIDRWRNIRDSVSFATETFPEMTPAEVSEMQDAAKYYVDAFQSARVSLFGSTKP